MELSELERLVQIVQNASIRDLTLRQGEARITIRKTAVRPAAPGTAMIPMPGASAEEAEPIFEGEWEGADTEYEEEDEPQDRTLRVTAPLVGIFHHVKPLIGLGAKVTQGQTVGVIEAMKLITEVTAPGSGRIIDTLIEDGLPVEYGQHLYTLQPEDEMAVS